MRLGTALVWLCGFSAFAQYSCVRQDQAVMVQSLSVSVQYDHADRVLPARNYCCVWAACSFVQAAGGNKFLHTETARSAETHCLVVETVWCDWLRLLLCLVVTKRVFESNGSELSVLNTFYRLTCLCFSWLCEEPNSPATSINF